MSEKPIPFKPIDTPTSEYEITSGQYKGWRIHMSIFVAKIVIEGINPDGTPKIKLNFTPNSTAIPPTLEEEDHR
jgi:hypothetical protein